MDIDDIRALLDYHYWARDRALAAVEPLSAEQLTREMGSSFRSIRDTLVHIYAAEWAGTRGGMASRPRRCSTRRSFRMSRRSASDGPPGGQVRSFVESAGEAGPPRVYEYKSLAGVPGRSELGQMIEHVVNHASYHRGQVTTMLRQVGAQPPKSLDLIAFYRERG